MNELSMPLSNVVINSYARDGTWCKLPYPGHPKGCPNFGKKDTCPPHALKFHEIVGKPPYVLVVIVFNLKEHADKMKERHPEWSERQARCLLYWQPKVNKKLKALAESTRLQLDKVSKKEWIIVENPEGSGVDIFSTIKKSVGVILERKYLTQEYIWKIMIIGEKRK